MNIIQEINNVNYKFATQGSKLKIEKRGEKLIFVVHYLPKKIKITLKFKEYLLV